MFTFVFKSILAESNLQFFGTHHFFLQICSSLPVSGCLSETERLTRYRSNYHLSQVRIMVEAVMINGSQKKAQIEEDSNSRDEDMQGAEEATGTDPEITEDVFPDTLEPKDKRRTEIKSNQMKMTFSFL